MKILFLSELFYPHGGGAELATYLYAKRLSDENHEIVVITNKFQKEPEFSHMDNFIIYRVPIFDNGLSLKYSTSLKVNYIISNLFKKFIKWADVVYIPRYWFSSIPILKYYKKPVIAHLHDYIPVCPLAILYNSENDRICEDKSICSTKCLYRFERNRRNVLLSLGSTTLNITIWPILKSFLKQSDAIICVSEVQKKLLIQNGLNQDVKMNVIYNPMPKISPIEILEDNFGYFGGLNYFKGYQVILRSLRSLMDEKVRDIHVYGTKFNTLSSLKSRKYNKLGLFTYSKLTNIEFNNLYKKIRTVLIPSIWHEPLPYVVSESLLKGRLVIASRVGGIPEILKECKGAYLFEPDDHSELAILMKYVKNIDEESAIDLGIKNRETFLRKNSKQDPIRQFEKICYKFI